MKINYHIHTLFSDGTAAMNEYCDRAVQRGFEEIAFTDHVTIYPDGKKSQHSLDRDLLPDYINAARDAKDKYKDRLKVKLGLEVDYIPGNEHYIEEMMSSYDFDLIIGSVHFVDNICIDCHRDKGKFDQEVQADGFDAFYERYLSLVEEAVRTGYFNVLGHMDLVRIWGFTPNGGTVQERRILNSVKEHGMALEVSSRGLRHPVNTIYPSPRIMANCFELGLPVSIGTDSHSLNEFDYAYDALIDYVKRFGCINIASFNEKVLTLKDL